MVRPAVTEPSSAVTVNEVHMQVIPFRSVQKRLRRRCSAATMLAPETAGTGTAAPYRSRET
ncbi:hypothetical protein NCAST_20_00820 [Nocardia asteroides NBRC 15531]|uniref:Uncharacterized protein n=1 Tax=Nocardia asteroides NBRC 15531 TaxID=1110697 RepID=U5EAQ5_NOCAS|nr:hypothetical protein NCAST_20_00820 [Nocardia asteroides NBRC 15531]